MKKIIKEIEDLLNSDLTSYKIAMGSGVANSMIQNYRNGKRKVENMTLKTALKLYEYIHKEDES